MIVLAVDTALAACSVAAVHQGSGRGIVEHSVPMVRGHAEALMPMIGDVLAEVGLKLSDIDRFAVTTGPGSFTGVRVGVAAVRGFALVTGRPAVGVSTLAALAQTARMAAIVGQQPFLVAIDARRDEIYAQCFEPNGGSLCEPVVAPVEQIVADLPKGTSAVFGSGAEMLAEAARAAGKKLEILGRDGAPRAAAVAELALRSEPGAPPRPIYLRAPDAKPQHGKAIARK